MQIFCTPARITEIVRALHESPSSVVTLLRPYKQPAFALLGFCSDLEFDFAELAFWLFDGRIVANRVSGANLVDQLRELRADLIFAGFHHLTAGTFCIFVNIARRVVPTGESKHRILAEGHNGKVGKGAALQQGRNHRSRLKYL